MEKLDDLISIYIISKDREKFLIRAINSCVEQSYFNVEILVVDDNSSTFNIHNLEAQFPNVMFFRNSNTMGANYCRNLALHKAKGRYITGLDDDDFFTKNRVEKLLRFYSQNSSRISCVTTRFLYSDLYCNKSKRAYLNYFFKYMSLLFYRGAYIDLENLLNKNKIGNQIFTEKSRLISVGGFDELLPALQDYETWLRLVEKYGPAYRLNTFTYIKDNSLPSITKNNRKKMLGFDYILKKHQYLFKGKEHCFELHKTLYKNGCISVNDSLKFFKKGNRAFIAKLFFIGKIRFFYK